MLQRVLDQGLQDEVGHRRATRIGWDAQVDRETIVKAYLHDSDVTLQQRELLGKRNLVGAGAFERRAQQLPELHDHPIRDVRSGVYEARDGVERVEQEVRSQLSFECFEARLR